MRLTLRALLAYLYNVLDPADADEFSGKVQESAVASGLVQRIGGITRKMRMGAPRIDAKGGADDANQVAEYLDNSLPEEIVGDFERSCINSDMHLAEVASSYQILTMVVQGKPADVSPALHSRICALPMDLATAHKVAGDGDSPQRERLKKTMEKVARTAKDTDAKVQAVNTASTHAVPEVPQYLRSGQRAGLGWWLGAAVVALVAVALAIRAAGPYDATNPIIGGLFKSFTEVADAGANNLPTGDADKSQDADDENAGTNEKTIEPDAENVVAAEPATNSDDGKTDAPAKPAAKGDSDQAAPKEVDQPDESAPIKPAVPVEPEPATSETGSDTKGKGKSTDKGGDSPPSTGVPEASSTPPPPSSDPMDVGRYVSDDQVLTKFDSASELWLRVPPRAILSAGERLVVLPTCRPQIALASGVQVTFAGESAVQLQEPLHAGASRMDVEFGRFLAATLGNAGAQLELNQQGVQGVLTLADTDTVVAVHVRHFLPPGSSREADARVLVIELAATKGNARWEGADKAPIEIPTHHVLTYVASSEPELSGPFAPPDWIDASSLSDIDRLTSLELQKGLTLDKPVHVRLAELMNDRRVDVRALAARSLAQIDEFDAIARELSTATQKSFWGAEVDTLRQALSRGPETAQRIYQSLESLYPKDAESLFRMLWGYSAQQLKDGSDQELVAMLESPEMAVRVLASDTLRQITGAQLLYRPEKPPVENRGSINRWLERQKEGSIAYKTLPAPLPERKPLLPPQAETKKGSAAKGKAEL